MRGMVVAWMLIASWPGVAGAADIEGKWGIGAGLFNGRGEVSLLRGTGPRRAWIADVSLSQAESDLNSKGSALVVPAPRGPSQWSITAGPRVRSFTRSTSSEALAPYWDLYLHGAYGRAYGGGIDSWSAGGEAGMDLGLEYFTPWSFSVAAHTSLAHVRLLWIKDRLGGTSGGVRTEGWAEDASLGISPALFVRGYF